MLTGALPQLAAAGALVVVLSALFAWLMSSPTPAAASAAPRKPAPARTTELRDFVKADLAPYTGVNGMPIYVAADGLVFNMSSHEGGPAFYGPGGSYSAFAGRDASVGLATMQTDASQWGERTVAQLTASERDTLGEWVTRFSVKYDVVGYLNDGARPRTVAGEASS